MFSFQNNNQVLFHLTQLTSAALNPRRPCSPRASGTVPNRQQQATVSQNEGDIEIICSESLNTAVNNCSEFTLNHLPKIKVGSLDKLAARLFWKQLTSLPLSKTKLLEPWQVTYSSSETFFENKHGFPKQHLLSVPSASITVSDKLARKLYYNILVGRPFVFDVQVRGFKTDRGIKAERLRNPTIGNRLSEALGLSDAEVGSPNLMSSTGEKLGTLQHSGVDAEKIKGKSFPLVIIIFHIWYGFCTMMADETLTTEEQQRMKVAFAEGYLAGTGQRPTGWTKKFLNVIQQTLTIVVLFVIFVSFMASASGSMFRIQLGSQVEVDPEEIHVTFDDVKGADEAKQELKDVVEFLKNPSKFSAVGAKLPKGVLLVGPPGTGKTLLARAVAVGSKRTNSTLHPFHQNQGVMVLGATNRRDDLDKALLRPGRFDVEVNVPTPDYTGRKEILSMYLGKVLSKDVDVEMLARGTTGFTGADLENMVNQAALKAAIDGPERKSRIPDEEANIITAYHEGGHAIVAYFTKDSHPLHKQATAIATHMVKEWGMSEKVGLRTLDGNNSTYVVVNEISPSTSDQIDSEIKRIMSESYERAKSILKAHQKEHKMLAEALLKYETLDAEDIKTIMAGEAPDKPQPV
ncbi:hypothetical protein C0J52_00920 [Blattella germanica]|nr:hypothetical protein C0J52_00920 [Blattella germanica]